MRIRIRIRIQHFFLIADPDSGSGSRIPDPDSGSGSRIRIQGLMISNWTKFTTRNLILIFLIKNCNLLGILGLHKGRKGRSSYRRNLQSSKENIQHFKRWKFCPFFYFLGSFLPSWIRIRIQQLKLMRIHAETLLITLNFFKKTTHHYSSSLALSKGCYRYLLVYFVFTNVCTLYPDRHWFSFHGS